MKILHVCNYNEKKWARRFYAPDRKLTNGLIRNGHFVYVFSYRDIARHSNIFSTKKLGSKRMNKRLLETCQNLQPEVLLLGHSELVRPATLLEVKRVCPDIRIAMWFVDTLSFEHNLLNLREKLPCIDALFVTTGGQELAGLKKYNQDCTIAYLPNMVDASIETGRAFEDKTVYDLVFIAGSSPEREALVGKLGERLPHLKCCIRGLAGNPGVDGAEFVELLSSSSLGLNYSYNNDTYLYTSDRISQIAGNGVTVLTPKIPGMELLFQADEVCYFQDEEELFSLVDLLTKDEKLRRKIGEKGWRKAHRHFSAEVVSAYILQVLSREKGTWLWEGQIHW